MNREGQLYFALSDTLQHQEPSDRRPADQTRPIRRSSSIRMRRGVPLATRQEQQSSPFYRNQVASSLCLLPGIPKNAEQSKENPGEGGTGRERERERERGEMLRILLLSLGLFLCAVLIVVYCLLMCILLSAGLREAVVAAVAAEGEGCREKGLTAEELERLEEGKMAIESGGVCAVCLDQMEEAQAARVLPRCRHAFHRSCVDTWLRRHPNCPLCRDRLLPPPSLPPSPPQPQPRSPSRAR